MKSDEVLQRSPHPLIEIARGLWRQRVERCLRLGNTVTKADQRVEDVFVYVVECRRTQRIDSFELAAQFKDDLLCNFFCRRRGRA